MLCDNCERYKKDCQNPRYGWTECPMFLQKDQPLTEADTIAGGVEKEHCRFTCEYYIGLLEKYGELLKRHAEMMDKYHMLRAKENIEKL